MKNVTIAILFIAAIAASAFYAGRRTAPQPTTVPGDSVPYPVYVKVPTPYFVERTDTLLKDADTAAILADYFAKVYYNDTLMNDTSAFIALTDTVSQNRIRGRSLMFQNRRPTAIITNTSVAAPSPSEQGLQLYGHLMLGKETAAPVIQVGWKEWQLSAGYNLQQSGVIVGVGYRFR